MVSVREMGSCLVCLVCPAKIVKSITRQILLEPQPSLAIVTATATVWVPERRAERSVIVWRFRQLVDDAVMFTFLRRYSISPTDGLSVCMYVSG